MTTALVSSFEISRIGDVYRLDVMTEGLSEPSAVLIIDQHQARVLGYSLSARVEKDAFNDFRTRSVNVIPFSANKRRQIRRPRRPKSPAESPA